MHTQTQERAVPRLSLVVVLIGVALLTVAGARPAAAALADEPGGPGPLVLDRVDTVTVANELRLGSAAATAKTLPVPVYDRATTTTVAPAPQRLTAITPTTAPPTTVPPTTAPPTTAPPTTAPPHHRGSAPAPAPGSRSRCLRSERWRLGSAGPV
ncbi:MAG: hypothetical protein WKF43_15500 [Acidimicrobiales bacterium]